ncbi:MAG: thioredoxin domain-containing protein [Patescibacteria group bacterium]|jgi:protein-disulfide isomerase
MSKQNKIILIIIAAVLAAGLFYVINNKELPQAPARENNGSEYQVSKLRPIDATDHIFGEAKASAQIIIYSNFECPFCAEFSQTIKKVEENFKDKVAIAYRHYPLPGYPEAEKAAEAAECAAEQGKFWQMHDKLFADNTAGRMSIEQFKIDAADLGLNQEQFNQCLDGGKYENKIGEQAAEGAGAGVTGTPTFFVNDYIYPGAYPFEDFIASDGRPEKGLKNIISEFLNKPL